MKKIRILNNDGLKKYADFLIRNHKQEVLEITPPKEILFDEQYSRDLSEPKELKEKSFSNRYELGKYYYNHLHETLTDKEIDGQGLWSWLSLYHWDLLYAGTLPRAEHFIPVGDKENIINATYVPFNITNPLEYRHPVKGYYHFYNYFGDNARILCSQKITSHGEVAEHIGGVLYLKQYKVIMDTLKSLFWNAEKKIFRKSDGTGALSTKMDSPGYLGGLRRARAVIDGLMTIYNFSKLKKSKLKELLGEEFH